MNTEWTILSTLFGVALIAVALRDIFQELFRPSGGGVLSVWLMRIVWKGLKPAALRRPTLLELAGPVVLVAVIGTWVALVAVGWALVYWPHLPGKFLFSVGLDPSDNAGFVDALYLSLVTLATLGYGEITPTSNWLRVLAPIEALIGFGILTAALSWVLSIYPVLSHRRSVAREVTLLRESERDEDAPTAIEHVSSLELTRILGELASRMVMVEVDLIQFPIAYYFHDGAERDALPLALPYLFHLAERVNGKEFPPEVRLRAKVLGGTIGDFSNRVASKAFLDLSGASTKEILEAYARDHLYEPPEDACSS